MKPKSIIIVSPITMYPVNNGGARRIIDLISYFKEKNHKVGLIAYDFKGHHDFFVDRVDSLWLFERKEKKKHAESFLQRHKDPGFANFAIDTIIKENPAAVISIFAWTADILYHLPKRILTFLDTIDIQHMRSINAKKSGGALDDRNCAKEEEINELYKTDILIAIQRKDKEFLERLCPTKKVILVEHAVHGSQRIYTAEESKKLLFVGNLYDPNVRGIKLFLDKCWRKIRKEIPHAEILICGQVCSAIEDYKKRKGVKLLYYVDDLLDYYRKAAVVLNVSLYGTGLPIKTVEALSLGKCVVCSKAAVDVLEEKIEEVPVILPDHDNMAQKIIHLLKNPEERKKIETEAWDYANKRFVPEKIYAELEGIIEDHVRISNNLHNPFYIINGDFETWTGNKSYNWKVSGEKVLKAKTGLKLTPKNMSISIFQEFSAVNAGGFHVSTRMRAKYGEGHKLFLIIAVRTGGKWIKVVRTEHSGSGEWEEVETGLEIPQDINDPQAQIKFEIRLIKGAKEAAYISQVESWVISAGAAVPPGKNTGKKRIFSRLKVSPLLITRKAFALLKRIGSKVKRKFFVR
ncbi:MAG: glycosyltransferase family 4 protein [Candidatus Aminicenantes bacterium]|nr:glycosyltransferase family 4 protein [Candidatus Aminicenantes bacterium]